MQSFLRPKQWTCESALLCLRQSWIRALPGRMSPESPDQIDPSRAAHPARESSGCPRWSPRGVNKRRHATLLVSVSTDVDFVGAKMLWLNKSAKDKFATNLPQLRWSSQLGKSKLNGNSLETGMFSGFASIFQELRDERNIS
jgi:hypothetical protein